MFFFFVFFCWLQSRMENDVVTRANQEQIVYHSPTRTLTLTQMRRSRFRCFVVQCSPFVGASCLSAAACHSSHNHTGSPPSDATFAPVFYKYLSSILLLWYFAFFCAHFFGCGSTLVHIWQFNQLIFSCIFLISLLSSKGWEIPTVSTDAGTLRSVYYAVHHLYIMDIWIHFVEYWQFWFIKDLNWQRLVVTCVEHGSPLNVCDIHFGTCRLKTEGDALLGFHFASVSVISICSHCEFIVTLRYLEVLQFPLKP